MHPKDKGKKIKKNLLRPLIDATENRNCFCMFWSIAINIDVLNISVIGDNRMKTFVNGNFTVELPLSASYGTGKNNNYCLVFLGRTT